MAFTFVIRKMHFGLSVPQSYAEMVLLILDSMFGGTTKGIFLSGALYIFVQFWELRIILSCERKIKGITLLSDSCFIPDSDMVTRVKTSLCEAAALKTKDDLMLSGIRAIADRAGSRKEHKGSAEFNQKISYMLYMCSLWYRYWKGQRISLK